MELSRLFRFRFYFVFFFSSLSTIVYCQPAEDTSLVLYFKIDSFNLDSAQRKSISQFVSSVKGIKEIVGYTDTVGTLSYNRILSRRRALTVYQLISILTTVDNNYRYLGEEYSQNADLSLNRKVEIAGYKLPINRAQGKTSDLRQDDQFDDSTTARLKEIDSFEIRNINFMPDRPIITPESINSIPHLIDKVKSYKDAQFEIIGHVNYQSERDEGFLKELYKLSEARAKVIYDILIQNGISDSLLKFRGVGNSLPLIRAPKNDQERMKNMRVQIIVYKVVSE